MNSDRVIKSNAKFFNTRTWAGGIWRVTTLSARGDKFQAAIGSGFVQKYLADRELPQAH